MPSSASGSSDDSPGFTCAVVSGSMKMPTGPSGVSMIRSSDTRVLPCMRWKEFRGRHTGLLEAT